MLQHKRCADGYCGKRFGCLRPDIFIDITALNFDSLGSLQFSLGWDPAVLQYVPVNNFNPALLLSASNFGIASVNTGFLAFSWTTNSLFGTTIPNGMCYLR